MREAPVEKKLKELLEAYGFKVLKLTCPGTAGVPDRMILPPTWSKAGKGPWYVECKAPGKYERRLQALIRDDWRARGMNVLDICDTYERAIEIAQQLYSECQQA